MIRHVIVEIRRNEGATIQNSFAQWEIPVLRAVHGVDAVKEVGERLVDRELPDPADEFQRLMNRYKRSRNEDGSKGTPYVHQVYGEFGEQKLAEAIQAAYCEAPEGDLVGAAPEVPAAAPPPAARGRRARGQNSSVGG